MLLLRLPHFTALWFLHITGINEAVAGATSRPQQRTWDLSHVASPTLVPTSASVTVDSALMTHGLFVRLWRHRLPHSCCSVGQRHYVTFPARLSPPRYFYTDLTWRYGVFCYHRLFCSISTSVSPSHNIACPHRIHRFFFEYNGRNGSRGFGWLW